MHSVKAKHILLSLFCFFMLIAVNRLSAEKTSSIHSSIQQVHQDGTFSKAPCLACIGLEEDANFYNPWSPKKLENKHHPKFRHVRNSNVQAAGLPQGWKYEIFYDAPHHDFNSGIDALAPPYYYAFLFRLTPF